jgi:hypothetical protein
MILKRRYSLLALTVGLLVLFAAGMATAHLYGMPSFIAALLSRPVSGLTEEDYRVYSGFVGDLFSSEHAVNIPKIGPGGTIFVAEQTISFRDRFSDFLPLGVAALGPEDMGRDFFRQNNQSWRLQPNFRSNQKLVLVDGDKHTSRSVASLGKDQQGSCVLKVSRAGFNRRGGLALLYYDYRCGASCCQSGWAVLEKNGGRWAIRQFGPGAIY